VPPRRRHVEEHEVAHADELREGLARERARADRLDRELAELRRSWWREIFG
jgi:hypothetical protein